jgi:hypothetical protein
MTLTFREIHSYRTQHTQTSQINAGNLTTKGTEVDVFYAVALYNFIGIGV